MCLAIPAEIVEINEAGMAKCRVGKSETYLTVSAMLLPERPAIGEYVIVHAGFALRVLDKAEAEETLRLLREMSEAVEGQPAGF